MSSLTIFGGSGGGSSVPAWAPTYKSLDYVLPQYANAAGAAAVAGTAYFAPVEIHRQVTVDQILARVNTLAASATGRLGVYTDAGGRPAALVDDKGTIDASTTGVKTIAYAKTLAAGRYWFCLQNEGGAPSYLAGGFHAGWAPVNDLTNPNTTGLSYAHTGALAADLTAQAFSFAVVPIVALRVA